VCPWFYYFLFFFFLQKKKKKQKEKCEIMGLSLHTPIPESARMVEQPL
jgi:hypothetical protein